MSIYKPARESYAARDSENKLLEINEDVLAERAHNEYLQILSELGLIGAALFAWLLAGVAYLFVRLCRRRRVSLASIAALVGIVAFLISSLASSYSFRVPANGLCFFFLLALLVKNSKLKIKDSAAGEPADAAFRIGRLRPIIVAAGLTICASTMIFSAVRGTSLMYLQLALTSSDDAQAERFYQKAIALDAREASFRYYYGVELYNQKRAAEAVPHLRFAVDNGVATSISYFQMASAQIVARQPLEADRTFAESLRVYPRSVFLRTAYASFLRERGETEESRIQYEKALLIGEKQAKSWMTAQTAGIKKLTEAESRDASLVKAMELRPIEGVYALLDFQSQFNPNLVRR
jgi:tetratricopeptide (TPR) repeat protein